MLKIAAVSYLNTQPFVHGLKQSTFEHRLDLMHPAACAQALINGQADIGLIPVAALKELQNYHIVSDYCIGTNGPVQSVMLYSQVPLDHIKTIVLDYQSRTSVNLVQVLCKHHWKINPTFVPANEGFEQEINDTQAAVVIGDRTFLLNNTFRYQWDLAQEWQNLTQLPFVFACWVALKPLNKEALEAFNLALTLGIEQIDKAIQHVQATHAYPVDVSHYLKENISYWFDEPKKQALSKFLNWLPA